MRSLSWDLTYSVGFVVCVQDGEKESSVKIFTSFDSIVGHWDCADTLQTYSKLSFSGAFGRGFDLTWNWHALCSAMNTRAIGTAGFLQIMQLQASLRDFPSLPQGTSLHSFLLSITSHLPLWDCTFATISFQMFSYKKEFLMLHCSWWEGCSVCSA